jgi:hypothetical protein
MQNRAYQSMLERCCILLFAWLLLDFGFFEFLAATTKKKITLLFSFFTTLCSCWCEFMLQNVQNVQLLVNKTKEKEAKTGRQKSSYAPVLYFYFTLKSHQEYLSHKRSYYGSSVKVCYSS